MLLHRKAGNSNQGSQLVNGLGPGKQSCVHVWKEIKAQQLILRSTGSQGNQFTPVWLDKMPKKSWNRQDNSDKNQKDFTLSEYCIME